MLVLDNIGPAPREWLNIRDASECECGEENTPGFMRLSDCAEGEW